MEDCNVSQSLVYKWRSDVKASRTRTTTLHEELVFSELLIKEEEPSQTKDREPNDRIQLSGRTSAMPFPVTYPVDDLIRILLAIEDRT